MSDRFLDRARSALIASAVSWGIMLSPVSAQSTANDAAAGKARFSLTSPDIANETEIVGLYGR